MPAPFRKLTAPAIPFAQPDIDTDQIIPKQFLKTLEKSGLGRFLFFDMRFDAQGKERPDFLLNRAPYRRGGILIAGSNFGCGSSREHAPWALKDFGIACILAPSFADIFHANCIKNGILPICLEASAHGALLARAEKDPDFRLEVDLETQSLLAGNRQIKFDIDPSAKKSLLEGLDEIALSLTAEKKIGDFEARRARKMPWL